MNGGNNQWDQSGTIVSRSTQHRERLLWHSCHHPPGLVITSTLESKTSGLNTYIHLHDHKFTILQVYIRAAKPFKIMLHELVGKCTSAQEFRNCLKMARLLESWVSETIISKITQCIGGNNPINQTKLSVHKSYRKTEPDLKIVEGRGGKVTRKWLYAGRAHLARAFLSFLIRSLFSFTLRHNY